MDTSDTASATARKDSSGFLDHVNLVELIKHSTELSASVSLDLSETSMETVSNPISSPTATRMKDTTLPSRPVSALKAPSTSKELANSFQNAQTMATTMERAASVIQDSP